METNIAKAKPYFTYNKTYLALVVRTRFKSTSCEAMNRVHKLRAKELIDASHLYHSPNLDVVGCTKSSAIDLTNFVF